MIIVVWQQQWLRVALKSFRISIFCIFSVHFLTPNSVALVTTVYKQSENEMKKKKRKKHKRIFYSPIQLAGAM